MADLEFAVVTKQCLDQRLPDQTTVRQQLGAWETRRNAAQATVNWQFTKGATQAEETLPRRINMVYY
jgi:hypothetical protein